MGVERWKCADCGAVFTEPVWETRREDMNGEGAWYTWVERRCPECGSKNNDYYYGDEDEDDAEKTAL